jgi:hypothetical protein
MQPSEFALPCFRARPSGRLLFVIHAARAAQMVDRPEQILTTKGGLVREIVVAETAPKTNEPLSPAGLAAYMGQRYTRMERLVNDDGEFDGGRVHQFKPAFDRPEPRKPRKRTERRATATIAEIVTREVLRVAKPATTAIQ